MDEREARLALACVVEPGDGRFSRLLMRYEPVEVWRGILGAETNPWGKRAKALDLGAMEEATRSLGARFVIPGDEEWPEGLHDLAHTEPVQELSGVPLGLWVRGRPLAETVAAAVAVVGSRASTPYGEQVAADLAAELAEAGCCIVSGGAYGIDAAAHRGALAEGGPTVAVMAGSLDDIYPKANAALIGRVVEAGALVSEYPPGEHPTRRRFLARNRLIAALSRGTVVVEAALRSGARNTATWASALHRVVMAVPGPVGSATSVTPHRLIREGEAMLVTNHHDVLELVGASPAPERPAQHRLFDALDAQQSAVFEALPSRGGRDVGDIALRAELSIGACLGVLGLLADAGLAVRRPDGTWRVGERLNGPVVKLAGRRP